MMAWKTREEGAGTQLPPQKGHQKTSEIVYTNGGPPKPTFFRGFLLVFTTWVFTKVAKNLYFSMSSWGLMVPVWVIPGLPTWDPAIGSSHFVVGTLKSILPREKTQCWRCFSKIKMWMMIDEDIQCLHMHTYIYIIYVVYMYIIYMLIHLAVSEISWRETSMWYRFNLCERYVRQMGNPPSMIWGPRIKDANENKTC